MKAAAMDPEALEGVTPGKLIWLSCDHNGDEAADGHAFLVIETPIENARKAPLCDEVEVRRKGDDPTRAAVIAVMRRMDELGQRHKAGLRDEALASSSFHRGAYLTTGTAVEELRVALGLPSEWRDGGEG